MTTSSLDTEIQEYFNNKDMVCYKPSTYFLKFFDHFITKYDNSKDLTFNRINMSAIVEDLSNITINGRNLFLLNITDLTKKSVGLPDFTTNITGNFNVIIINSVDLASTNKVNFNITDTNRQYNIYKFIIDHIKQKRDNSLEITDDSRTTISVPDPTVRYIIFNNLKTNETITINAYYPLVIITVNSTVKLQVIFKTR